MPLRSPLVTVLLVEDNETHAHLIQRHLEKAADDTLQLRHVTRLSDAFEFLDRNECNVVLLDLSLPDSDIRETLPRFLEAKGELPVIVLTSLDDLEFGTSAVQQGAQDYLFKSDLNGQLLLRSIRYAIERKKTRESLEAYAAELARSNEHLQGFAHTVAHEVKSPLHIVALCLQVLELRLHQHLDDETRDFTRDAATAIRGMTDLVNELLEFARVGNAGDDFGPVDLDAVFNQAIAMLRSAVRQSGARVTHAALPTVRGNEVQLRQLLQNLLGNALKYRSQPQPEIEILVDENDAEWTLGVRDNGIGIAPEYHQRVFDVFTRLHNQDEIPGTGIGLAFCRRIVEHHGGHIWVESVLGKGSLFRFTLPKKATPPESSSP